MSSYRVVPDGSGWQVMKASSNRKTHQTVSNHRKKTAAKRKARRLASSGDSLTILKANGAIQTKNTVR